MVRLSRLIGCSTSFLNHFLQAKKLRHDKTIMGLMSIDTKNKTWFISLKLRVLHLFRLGIIALILVFGII
jgi:hypothetical protein